MIAESGSYWAVIALVGAMYVMMCGRVAVRMATIGRSGVKWFFISLLCTAIPAAIVLRRHAGKVRASGQRDGRPTGRCRHCGAVLGRAAKGTPGVCGECGMTLDEETLA